MTARVALPSVIVLTALAVAGCTASPVRAAAGRLHRTSAASSSTPSSTPRSAPGSTPQSTASDAPTPTATSDDGATATYPTVGVLMRDGSHGVHGCTASVVASSSADTVLTAAHCVHGTGTDLTFVPAYRRGAAPFGTWRVTAAFVSARWQQDSDPQYDYAVLTVSARTVRGRPETLGASTGTEQVGRTPSAGAEVTVVAYRYGSGDAPVLCRAAVYFVQGFPTIDCHGFSGGTSGGPWLTRDGAGSVVVGVIGGRDEGGCHEYTSHTSTFTADVGLLIRRAERGTSPDSVGPGGESRC